MDKLGNVLKQARKSSGKTVKDASELLIKNGFRASENTVYNWENNNSQPTPDALLLLCNLYGIKDVLSAFGYGNENSLTDKTTTAFENEHIKKYRSLDDHGKKIVDFVVSEELERMEQESTKECCPESNIVKLSYFDLPASAGFGLPLEGEYRTIIEVPKNDLTKKADFAIRVAGDSMEPDYFDGEIVLVKKGEVHRGDVGIFVLDGESYVKELGKDVLISRNKKYLDISLKGVENIFVAGKVIGKL